MEATRQSLVLLQWEVVEEVLIPMATTMARLVDQVVVERTGLVKQEELVQPAKASMVGGPAM
jgi:hypothetical protein